MNPLVCVCCHRRLPSLVEAARVYPGEDTVVSCVRCEASVATYDSPAAQLREADTVQPATDLAQQPEWLLSQARRFIAGQPPTDARETAAWARWRPLARTPAASWMPVGLASRVIPAFGRAIVATRTGGVVNGRHRLALAAVRGEAVPIAPALTPGHEFAPWDHYQTAAWPDGLVAGARPLDRWPLWPEVLRGQHIVELGCAHAMDGILACVCGAAGYFGVDKNPDAIAAGRRLAAAWGVSDRVTLIVADVNAATVAIPRADVAWVLSTSIQIAMATHQRAIHESGATTVYLETHREPGHVDDAASARNLHALGREWSLLGVSVFGHPYPDRRCRSLYRGTARKDT